MTRRKKECEKKEKKRCIRYLTLLIEARYKSPWTFTTIPKRGNAYLGSSRWLVALHLVVTFTALLVFPPTH